MAAAVKATAPPLVAAPAADPAAGVSQQQPHSGALGDAQNRTPEPSISGTAAAMQQLDLDTSERTAASSPPAAPSRQQSADDWMICPLTKVGEDSGQAYEKLACVSLCTAGSCRERHAARSCRCDMQVVMDDPVMCSDGHTYSRAAITAWLDANGAVSPLTSQPLARAELIPNHALRNTIEAMLRCKR